MCTEWHWQQDDNENDEEGSGCFLSPQQVVEAVRLQNVDWSLEALKVCSVVELAMVVAMVSLQR